MPDVFTGNWIPSLANLHPAGAQGLYLKIPGDDAYYNMGAPRDVDIKMKDLFKPDSLLRTRPWGSKVDITIPVIQASVVEIKLLSQFITGANLPIAVGIEFADDLVLATEDKLSVRWKLDSGGDFDDLRMISYLFQGNLKRSEMDSIISATPITKGTPGTSDILYTLAQTLVSADNMPNGFEKVEFKAIGDADNVDLGDFREGKYTFECVGEQGGGGRGLFRTVAIKFTFDAIGHETDIDQIGLMDAIQSNDLDLQLSHMDGMVMNIEGERIGMTSSLENVGNTDKIRTIKFHAEGSITDFTTWSAMFTAP